jgi:SAM-dependent methyltransferase
VASRFGGYENLEFVAESYDPVYEHLRREDIEFFIAYSQRARGRTLELGCGTGRVLIPAAISGCEITGLDISAYMLQKCRAKLEKQTEEVQKRVRLVQGNMTDFNTDETYPLVTIPFRPFQHLISVEEQKACLQCINRHLIPQGLLIFDLFHPFPPRLVYDPKYTAEIEDLPEIELPDGRTLRRTSRISGFHRDKQYNDVELIHYVSHPDGRTERLVDAFPMRYFFRYEVEHLLDLCGFQVIDLFGDFARSSFSTNSPEMIFVAEKK